MILKSENIEQLSSLQALTKKARELNIWSTTEYHPKLWVGQYRTKTLIEIKVCLNLT